MKKKYIYFVLLILIAGALGVYKYTYKPHKDIQKTSAEFVLEATELLQYFSEDATASSEKYLNTVITVNGEITEKDNESVLLSNAVLCYFLDSIPETNTQVRVKGRCIGYDELLETVKLDQCAFVN